MYLDEADRQAIARIKQLYGITSESDAIRLAFCFTGEKAQGRK